MEKLPARKGRIIFLALRTSVNHKWFVVTIHQFAFMPNKLFAEPDLFVDDMYSAFKAKLLSSFSKHLFD